MKNEILKQDNKLWRLHGCNHCGGDQHIETEEYNRYWVCLQCSKKQIILEPIGKGYNHVRV